MVLKEKKHTNEHCSSGWGNMIYWLDSHCAGMWTSHYISLHYPLLFYRLMSYMCWDYCNIDLWALVKSSCLCLFFSSFIFKSTWSLQLSSSFTFLFYFCILFVFTYTKGMTLNIDKGCVLSFGGLCSSFEPVNSVIKAIPLCLNSSRRGPELTLSPTQPAPLRFSVFLSLWAGLFPNVCLELMLVILMKQWEGHNHPAGNSQHPPPSLLLQHSSFSLLSCFISVCFCSLNSSFSS